MKFAIILLSILGIAFALTPEYKEKEEIIESFNKNEIIPDVIDTPPEEFITVKFGTENVTLGIVLTATEVKNKPEVIWKVDPDKLYLLSMVDPDAISRKEPNYRSANHWLVGNIPGTDITKGEILASFIPSGPPKDTGLHRYIFLVFEQPEELTFDEPRINPGALLDRANFDVRKLATKYNLGNPKAGNFYQAEWDESVPPFQN